MHHLGETRSASHRNYALLTPETFVRAPLPGMSRATAIVHTSPAMGAAFTQYTAEFEEGGSLGPAAAQRFVYTLEGELQVKAGGQSHRLAPGGYAYLPVDGPSITSPAGSAARLSLGATPVRPCPPREDLSVRQFSDSRAAESTGGNRAPEWAASNFDDAAQHRIPRGAVRFGAKSRGLLVAHHDFLIGIPLNRTTSEAK